MQHKGTVVLDTNHLILRPFTLDDVETSYTNWCSDPLVCQYITWQPHQDVVATRLIISEWISHYKQPRFYQWAIELKEIHQVIGTISVVSRNEEVNELELGYVLGRNWWHHGYTSEALQAVIDFLFGQVHANRIMAKHDVENPHSGQVMMKCGMKFEGTLRQGGKNNRGIVDLNKYSILYDDYITSNVH